MMGSTNSCLLLSYAGRIVRGGKFCVNWTACASRRKSLQNFLTFSAQCCSPRAALKNVPRCARRASKFCLWIQCSAADCGVHRLEFELNCYASFSTATLICAVTSRNTLMVTGNSPMRSEEHTSELQSRVDLVCRLLLEKKKKIK